MDIITACRIMGLEANATVEELESTKRKLLQAFHPDKHPAQQKEVFERMTREIIEAAGTLLKTAKAQRHNAAPQDDKTILEQTLFEKVNKKKYRGQALGSKDIAIYKKRYHNDDALAIGIISIAHGYSWQENGFLGLGESRACSGSAVNLTVMNRTDKEITGLHIGQNCFLLDDTGFQYAPANISFYWMANDNFNSHSDFLAPNAIIDGFVLFPHLRPESTRFTRWLLRSNFKLGNNYHNGNYDVQLI